MKTNIIANKIVINTIMKKYIKYLCAVLMIIGTSAHAWGVTYQKVTDVSQIADGDVVIITNNLAATGSGNAMSNSVSGNYYGSVSVTSSSNKITYSGTDIMVLTVRRNTKATPNLFAFWTGDGYLYDDGSNNHLKVNSGSYSDGMASGRDWCWTIALSDGSNPNKCMDILNNKNTTRWLQYNTNGFKSTSTYITYAQACIWKVACSEPTLTLSPSSKTMTYGDDGNTFTITKTTNSTGTISWSSTNTSVATVAKNGSGNGVVTVVGAGTTKIKCTVGEAGDYCEKEVELSLTVNPACPTLAKGTDAKALTAGSITSTSATLSGGIVTYKGGANLTAYGFVYGTSANPTTSNSTANVGVNIAENTAFGSKTITGLTPNQTYYVRVYGTNGCGTRYSPDGTSGYITFTTLQRYSIDYNANGGSGEISTQYKDAGGTATLNSGAGFSRTGYTLSKWNTAEGGGGTDYALSGSYTADANVTLYAVWANASYTITLDNQSATSAGTTSINVKYDKNTNLTGTAITVPTRTGYTFGGYYTAKNGGGVQIIAANGSVVASASGGGNTYTDASKNWKYANSITLYAKWTANTISLTLDRNGVTGTDGSATITFDGTALNATPTHATNSDATYSLYGYYAEAGKTNKILDASGNVVNATVSGYITDGKWTRATTPTTLYAKWSKNMCTVTFNMNGHGDQVSAQEVEQGEKVVDPGTTTIVDWQFLGWFTDPSSGSQWDFSTNTVAGNMTLYAHWEETEYNLTTLKAWCVPDLTISGDIHLTSAKDVSVYATLASGNLLRIQSDDLSGTEKLEIKYLDADNGDAEVAAASSRFRLCNNGTPNYTEVDGSPIDVSGSNTFDQTYSIRYTPTAYNVTHHYKLQIAMKRGSGVDERTLKTETWDLYGRALPEEFVIAVKYSGTGGDNKWYALPNDLAATNGAASPATPIKITVDNTTTPTKAVYAPENTVYKAMNRYEPGSNDQFASVRFTSTGSNYLTGGSSNHKLWLATGNDKNSNWWLQSTNLQAYTVKSDPANGSSKLIGLYLNSGLKMGFHTSGDKGNAIYFLPIETVLTDNEAIVNEWGKKSIVVEVDAQTASSARARVDDGDPETAATFGETKTSLKNSASKYNYTLTFSTLDFSDDKKGKLLYIDWLDAEGEVINTSTVTIPWIIASNCAAHDIDNTNAHWNTEVHVLPNVVFEADAGNFTGNSLTIAHLEIYPGATVKVTKGTKAKGTLTATTLVLHNGWSRAGEKSYGVSRLYINPDATTLKATNVYADWYIDYDQFYPVAVPWKVTVNSTNIKYMNSTADMTFGPSGRLRLQYYDGASRASGGEVGTNWKEYGAAGNTAMPGTLTPATGYSMTAKRPTGKAFSIVRMTLALPSGTWDAGSWTTNGEQGEVSSVYKNKVTVTAHSSSDWFAKGWNYIANPYMATFNGNVDGITGSLHNQNDESVKYATIWHPEYGDYDQISLTGGSAGIPPQTGFLVQVATGGTLTFSNGQIISSAPARYTNTQAVIAEQEAYINLSSETENDQMGLIIGSDYTEQYEVNADLVKMMGDANSLKTYMRYSEMDLAFVAVNEQLAQEWIPVVAKIPAAGDYTYSLQNNSKVSELEGVYLTDYWTGVTTNLLDDDYTFNAPAGTISDRFAINAIVGERQTPTGADITGLDMNSTKAVKFIWHDRVFILHNGVIYDSTGKRVNVINK